MLEIDSSVVKSVKTLIYFSRFEQKNKKTIIVLPWLTIRWREQREPAFHVGVIRILYVQTKTMFGKCGRGVVVAYMYF
jgi:hypothetical protein